jgi:hypothetical protein
MGPHERFLGDAASGDLTLFARKRGGRRAADPVLGSTTTPLSEYEPSTRGPARVDQTPAPDEGWHEPRPREVSG